MKVPLYRIGHWIEKKLGGHITVKLFGRSVTVYGINAMHIALEISTRWGYVCFHPPFRWYGHWWPWYFYISPNATPWASTMAIGPGVSKENKRGARIRRAIYGIGYSCSGLSYQQIRLDQIDFLFISQQVGELNELREWLHNTFGELAQGNTLREQVESVVRHYATQLGRWAGKQTV